MIEICSNNYEEDITVKKAVELLKENNIEARAVYKSENYANTRWSIDDLKDIEEIKNSSDKEKLHFLNHAEEQIWSKEDGTV